MTTSTAIRRSVDEALADLRRLHADAIAATTVRHAVDLTRITLECFWMPALAADGHIDEG